MKTPLTKYTPLEKYKIHKKNAKQRGILFNLTFEEWWDIWQKSGHWEERGSGRGSYCMSRYGDMGSYEISNVFIQTNAQNVIDAHIGIHHTPEALSKISSSRSGIPVSPEHRAKISAAHTGKKRGPYSPEHRAKISAAHVGKTISPEHRAKISASVKEARRKKKW